MEFYIYLPTYYSNSNRTGYVHIVTMVRSIHWNCYIYHFVKERRSIQWSCNLSLLLAATENTTDIFSDDDCNAPRQKLKSAVNRDLLSTNESPPPARAQFLEPPTAAASRAPMAQPLARQPSTPASLPPHDTESCPIACEDIGPHTSVVTVNDATITTDVDVVDILGDDPTQTTEFGKDIHAGLVNRLNHIIINGLENDVRKELCKKHLIPANCPRMVPPILNPEIKVAIPEASLKRDKGIENRQKQLATALACLSDVMTTKMQEKDKDSALIKQLMDVAKLMCDSLHSDSAKRRYFALSSLKKDVNDHLIQTKIDKYLFGETLAETLKTAKAVSKSGADIKVAYDKNKKTNQPQPSTSRGLNWKAPPPTGRQSGPPRSRQTYPPAAARPGPPGRPPPPHANSSKTSRFQPRPNRRY